MNEIVSKFSQIGIIPVIKLDDAKDAVPLAKALIDGGLPVAEVTFRTAAAKESIKLMAEAFPEMLVGAGTVLTTEQVDAAIEAGAKFIVSPGLNPKIVKYCQEKGIVITPGCSSPTDIEVALELGLEVVKFFPAEASGGIAKIKAMAAPYTGVKFMPTGGVNAKNLNDYLSFNKVIACGGSYMVSDALVKEGKFDEITKLTKEAVATMLAFDLKHIGVNAENAEEALQTAKIFETMFNFETKVGGKSTFAGTQIEIMNTPGRGKHGHIAISTNSVERAMYHLGLKGIEFDMDTLKIKDGKAQFVYLKEEFLGFAVHLVVK